MIRVRAERAVAPAVLLVLQLQASYVASIELVPPDAVEQAGVVREVVALLVVLAVVELLRQAGADVETALRVSVRSCLDLGGQLHELLLALLGALLAKVDLAPDGLKNPSRRLVLLLHGQAEPVVLLATEVGQRCRVRPGKDVLRLDLLLVAAVRCRERRCLVLDGLRGHR